MTLAATIGGSYRNVFEVTEAFSFSFALSNTFTAALDLKSTSD